MNQYAIIAIVLVALLGIGVAVKFVKPKSEVGNVEFTGNTVNVRLVAKQNRWQWEPEEIKITAGDKVVMEVVNEDEYDHGLAVDGYGINQRMPANSTIKIEFIAERRGGFAFYCSVPCGKGVVDGKERSHFDMVGKIIVE